MNSILNKPIEDQFKIWHYVMNKPYTLNSEEAERKLKIYKESVKLIKESNEVNKSYTLGLSTFADMSDEEFNKLYDISNSLKINNDNSSKLIARDDEGMPDTIDYSDSFPGVRNQGGCGSCYAFAALGVAEYFMTKQLNIKHEYLSVQQLVDCGIEFAYGCKGGNYPNIFAYMAVNGIALETDFPYEGYQNKYCKFEENLDEPDKVLPKPYIKLIGVKFCDNAYTGMECSYKKQRELLERGPFAAVIAMPTSIGKFYQDGIIDKPCYPPINHAVMVVQMTNDYYKIRNSYSEDWGYNGYGKIKRDEKKRVDGKQTDCGLNEQAYQPEFIRKFQN